MVRTECNYRSPALLGETITIAARISALKNSSFIFEYRLTESRTGRLIADGLSVQACYDMKSGRDGSDFREDAATGQGLRGTGLKAFPRLPPGAARRRRVGGELIAGIRRGGRGGFPGRGFQNPQILQKRGWTTPASVMMAAT